MRHLFHIQAHNQAATLERLLRVTRHRGFTVSAMDVQTENTMGHLKISLSVDGERPPHTLVYQLMKLAEVTLVETPKPVEHQRENALGLTIRQ